MFTWTEQVGLIILEKLNDPNLVIHFMGILKPMRLEYLSEDARVFHESLRLSQQDRRLSQQDRRLRTSQLKDQGKFHGRSPCVPMTFPLPFNGKMWRNYKKVSKMITFMRDGYIRTPSLNEEALSIRAPIKSKVELVNLLYGDNCESTVFLAMFSITDAVEALKDFILIDEDDSLTLGESERGWEDQPYLTASEHYNDSYHKTFKYMSIVN
jgi:hypothetical protein